MVEDRECVHVMQSLRPTSSPKPELLMTQQTCTQEQTGHNVASAMIAKLDDWEFCAYSVYP